jgi:hypothetical protein
MTYRGRAIAEPSNGPTRGSLPNEIETVKRYCQFVRESLTCGVQISRHGSSSGLSESSRKARRLALRVTGAKFGCRMNTCTPQAERCIRR